VSGGATNLLVILSDQLQRDCLGVYGGPVPTPNLARLAAGGMVFERAYCASPLCVPTRPSIQTGTWPHQHGSICFGAGYERVRPGAELLLDKLAAAGYRVGYDGIWHVNRAPGDEARNAAFATFRPGQFPYAEFARMFVAQGGEDGEQRAKVRTPTDDGWHDWTFSLPTPAVWTEPLSTHPDRGRAERVAEELKRSQGPCCWFCSFAAPHPPILVPEAYHGRFRPEEMVPPASFGEATDGLPSGVRDAPGAQSVRDWSWERWAPCVAAYFDYVPFVDDNVGLLLDALGQSGRADETLVVFAADHGECLAAHNLYQKGVAYEESSAVPLIITGPGIRSGREAGLVSQVDLAPTILDLLGLEPLTGASGRSLAPALRAGEPAGGDEAFVEFNGYLGGGPGWRCVVTTRHKLVVYDDGAEQLFDLAADPAELRNLACSAPHETLRGELAARLDRWAATTADKGRRRG
jgi:arylsulfatase A-like enzyme